MIADKPKNIDEYIGRFPLNVKIILEEIRDTVKKAAPQAQEVISYGMPAFKMNRILVYFAGYAKHIGFYPGPDAIIQFKAEIEIYKWAKGSIQFPVNKPLPLTLIEKIVIFKVKREATLMKRV